MINPKISIITVSYNAVKTIEQTICSVVNQTYDNIEYIIIDGGSTDGTVDIIKKYESKIAYWVSEPDKGIYDAMNKGIKRSSGQIIGIINADDWYDVNTVRKVAEQFINSKIDIVHGDIFTVLPNGDIYAKYKPAKKIEDLIWHEMPIYHPTCFIRKNIYNRFGLFSIKYKIAADYELILRFYLKNVIFKYLEDDIAYFRLAGASDFNAQVAQSEVKEISIHYGYSRIYANLWYLKNRITRVVKDYLEYMGLDFLVEFYRKKKSNIRLISSK